MPKIITADNDDTSVEQERKPAFRGVVVKIDERGNMAMQLQGINTIEAYGALKLILDNLETKLRQT